MPLTQRIGTRFVAHRSGVWSPLSIPGLRLWLRADVGLWQDSVGGTPAASDGDVVGAWEDFSGNSNHATQATTSLKPLLRKASLNGYDAVLLDGADDYLVLTSALSPTNVTVLAVTKPTGTWDKTTTCAFLFCRVASTQPRGLIGWGSLTGNLTDEVIWFLALTDPGPQVYGVGACGALSITTAKAYSFRLSGTTETIRMNSVVQTLTASIAGRLDSSTDKRFVNVDQIGVLSGSIREILVYDSALSDSQLQTLENYLIAGSGIT